MNKVLLVGKIASEPKIKEERCEFHLVTTEKWKSKKGPAERKEVHLIVCRNGMARVASDKLLLGDLVSVEGRIRKRGWLDSNKVAHVSVEIEVDKWEEL